MAADMGCFNFTSLSAYAHEALEQPTSGEKNLAPRAAERPSPISAGVKFRSFEYLCAQKAHGDLPFQIN
jgi:hypothetical protein